MTGSVTRAGRGLRLAWRATIARHAMIARHATITRRRWVALTSLVALTLFAGLAGCSTIYSYTSGSEAAGQADAAGSSAQQGRGLGSAARSLINLVRPAPPPPLPSEALTPQVLAAITQPYLLLIFEASEGGFDTSRRWAGFAEAGRNRNVTTWVEGSARTISVTSSGLLLATRGFGRDLMTARADRLQQVLTRRAGGAADAVRVNRTLDGENQIVTTAMVCRITRRGPTTLRLLTGSFAVQQIDEACLLEDGQEIINRYWIDQAGVPRQSDQWVSPELGTVRLQRLR